jgi:hypothetical protein
LLVEDSSFICLPLSLSCQPIIYKTKLGLLHPPFTTQFKVVNSKQT